MSTGNRIDYCFMSTAFKEIRGFQWLRKNSPVPSLTLTHALGRDPSRVARVERLEGETNLSDWFGGYKNVKLNEEAVGLGRYGKVLTVLYTDGLEAKEEDEDGELEELNGELAWPARKRRR